MRRFTHICKTAASVFLGLSLIFSSMVVGIRHEHQVSVSDVHLHKDHSHGDHSHSDHSHGEHATHCGPQHGHQHLHFAGRAVAGDHHRNERDGSIAIFETSETSINAHQSSQYRETGSSGSSTSICLLIRLVLSIARYQSTLFKCFIPRMLQSGFNRKPVFWFSSACSSWRFHNYVLCAPSFVCSHGNAS